MNKKTEKDNKIVLSLHHMLRGVIAVAFTLFLINGNWSNAFMTAIIFGLMITPSILKNKYQIYIPLGFDFSIALFIYLTLFLGSVRKFYERFTWWDGLLHFQSGLLLGVIGFLLVYILNERKTDKLTLGPGFVAIFSFCFSLALANLWEIYEFIGDSLFGFAMQESGLPDTMGDLIVNAVGALIVSTVGYIWMKRSRTLPFTPR
jgi:hypothetical protein